MRKRNRIPTTLCLLIALVVMSSGPAALAAPAAASQADAGRHGALVPLWLWNFLSWLDRGSEPTQSTCAASQDSGTATGPEAPGVDVTPQAGPALDPDG